MISWNKVRYIIHSKQLNHIEKQEMQDAVIGLNDYIAELREEIDTLNKDISIYEVERPLNPYLTIESWKSRCGCEVCGSKTIDAFQVALHYDCDIQNDGAWRRGRTHIYCEKCTAKMIPHILPLVSLVADVETKKITDSLQ